MYSVVQTVTFNRAVKTRAQSIHLQLLQKCTTIGNNWLKDKMAKPAILILKAVLFDIKIFSFLINFENNQRTKNL